MLVWKTLPKTTLDFLSREHTSHAEDLEQLKPLTLQLLFEPADDGFYDTGWIAERGAMLKRGDAVIRAYRVSDGMPFIQTAPFPMTILTPLVERNHKVRAESPIARIKLPSLALDFTDIRQEMHLMLMNLAQAVNAVFKGYMGSIGESGQVTDRVLPVQVQLHPEHGYDALLQQIVGALADAELADGDIVVVSEKIWAIAEERLFPLELLYRNDPKTTDQSGRERLLAEVQQYVPQATLPDLICADSLLDWPGGPMATLGPSDPNKVAFDLAKIISHTYGVRCDVVISDTDTGLDIREMLINCITIGCTPLGATAGLVIYECMRVANAAEFVRGSHRGIPIVISKPHPRCAARRGMGEFRGYSGRLDAARERLLGFA